MNGQRGGAIALLAGTAIWTVVMFYHPTHSQGRPLIGVYDLSDIVHGSALLAKPLLIYGFWTFARSLGFDRVFVGLGFVAYAMGVGVMAIAGVVSGWVTSEVVSAVQAAAPADQANLIQIGRFSVWMNRGLAEVSVLLVSSGYIFWAIGWPDRSPVILALRLWGLIVGAGILGWMALGTFEPSPALMIFVVALHSSWAAAVALVLLRTRQNNEEA